jgi:hypothetical protein
VEGAEEAPEVGGEGREEVAVRAGPGEGSPPRADAAPLTDRAPPR